MQSVTGHLQAVFGLIVFILIAWGLSERRSRPDWRLISVGLGVQVVIALLMFKVPAIQSLLGLLNQGVIAMVSATETGTQFVFGYLGGDVSNVAYPFGVENPGATFILAFRVLPLILFFTVLSAILWHYRVLPIIIRGFSYLLRRTLNVGGAVGVSTAGNIFLGMVEAPLLIRPFLNQLSRSELFVVMTCGMATVAGSVMILYSVILQDVLDNALGHVLTASVISAPAAIMIARIMIPGDTSTGSDEIVNPVEYTGLLDAITRSTADGIRLMVNVGAMLIVLTALVALVNSALSLLPEIGGMTVSMQSIFGLVFTPVVWLMGIPWAESFTAGSLMGTKTVLNELFAFFALAAVEPGALSSKSVLILTYALCGFANFGSLGIMVGGLAGMCPERREEIVQLAPRTLISGTLATCMTGAIAGLLI
ncbi:MAG: nucleoside transporter C-terminal domain-containing protein [bacterium]|nr:nucleoside:proton symporter [Gammaproteobacteria bacterium]HIL98419.1 nucleoside:proton symporter [Pseudomonadales bacterium]